MIIRGQDCHGSGAYLASRGSRKHQGIDIVTEIDEDIKSRCCGEVTKIGWPYASKDKSFYRYVQVTDLDGIQVRHFYVKPGVSVGDIVHKGQSIGTSQDLTQTYPGITQHLHFEVKKGGAFLNPLKYLGIE